MRVPVTLRHVFVAAVLLAALVGFGGGMLPTAASQVSHQPLRMQNLHGQQVALTPPIRESVPQAQRFEVPLPPNGAGVIVVMGNGAGAPASPSPKPTPIADCWLYSGNPWSIDYSWVPPGSSGGLGHWIPDVAAGSGTNHKLYVGVNASNGSGIIAVLNNDAKELYHLLPPSATLGLAVDALGNVYAANFPSNTISVFAKGSRMPTKTLTDGNMSTIYYLTVDAKGNLFEDGWGPGGSNTGIQLDEFPAGSQTPVVLVTLKPPSFPGGLAIDKKETLYVADEGNGSRGAISELAPPYNKVRHSIPYSGLITGIALDKSQTHVWGANNLSVPAGGDAGEEYAVSTGRLINYTPAQSPGLVTYGIAVVPYMGT